MNLKIPKKNLIPILLGILALGIWGYNSYSFFRGVTSTNDMDDFQSSDIVNNKLADRSKPNPIDGWVYEARYRDPFENWLIQKRRQKPVLPKKQKKAPRKKVVPLVQPPKLRLTGVIADSLSRLAVIEDANQHVFFARPGDSIAGVTILSIESRKIDCEYQEKMFSLRLK